MSTAGIISISPNDVITIQAKTQNTNRDLTIKKATLVLFKLADTNISKYAGEKIITPSQTVDIVTQGFWTTVGTFTVGGLNGWAHTSNLFTPTSGDAGGFYALEYTISASTVNATGDNFEMGVFVKGVLHPELTVMRKLSGTSDTGCLCGVGLLNIDDGTSTVTLKVRNLTSASDLIFKKAFLGLQQIHYVNYDVALPISLNSFNVEKQNNTVKLNWQTASEVENLGYKIYRKEDEGLFKEISSYAYNDALRGQGTTTDMHDYEFIDTNVEPAKEYTYLLSDISYQMEEIKHIDYLRTIYLPEGIQVDAAYPNPFNPLCTIPYTIDVNEHVRIDLLDISGKIIRTLVSKDHTPGNYNVDINEPTLGSGVYLIRVQAGEQVKIQKIMMLK